MSLEISPETPINMTAIISIIIGMGLLGGLANFFSTRTAKDDCWHFWKCIVCGISAAIVVPLFLQTIQSDLMNKLGQDRINYLVFAGFCLIAAFASRTFLDSLAKQALQTANEAEAKSKAAEEKAENSSARTEALASDLESVKEEVKPVTEKFTEEPPEPIASVQESTPSEIQPSDLVNEKGGQKNIITGVDAEGVKVLKALASPQYTFRTLEGLQTETGLSPQDVNSQLIWFKLCGFANQIKRENGMRWYLTAKGRKLTLNPNLPKTLKSEPTPPDL
jgi:hypothetical protein